MDTSTELLHSTLIEINSNSSLKSWLESIISYTSKIIFSYNLGNVALCTFSIQLHSETKKQDKENSIISTWLSSLHLYIWTVTVKILQLVMGNRRSGDGT